MSSLLLLNGKKRHNRKVIINNSILMSKFVDIEPEYRRSTKPKEIITTSTNAIDFKNNVYEIVINK